MFCANFCSKFFLDLRISDFAALHAALTAGCCASLLLYIFLFFITCLNALCTRIGHYGAIQMLYYYYYYYCGGTGFPKFRFPLPVEARKISSFFCTTLNLVSIQNRGIFLSPSAWDRITARAGLVTR